MRKIHDKISKIAQVKPGEHLVQVIYIESSSKRRSPLGDRYLSAPIAKRLARSLRRRKVPGSNPTVGKNLYSQLAFQTGLVSPCK